VGVTIPRAAAVVLWHAALVPLFASLPVVLSRVGTRHGWRNGRPGPANLLGVVPMAAGGGLVASAVACHYRAIPDGWRVQATITPDYLLQDGPYAHSRNPMFLGQATFWAGWAMLCGSLPVATGLVAFVGVWAIGSGFEERGLHKRFGAEYDAYRSRVPRLLDVTSLRRRAWRTRSDRAQSAQRPRS
jgi:protein-S-isoprenylcysteine O-methyltransferase Ste14